jgi:NADH:ubiquinone reductase (H+-translocating)
MTEQKEVVIVGAGFAGLGCAKELAKHDEDVHVTLIDKHNYHQFLPLMYQVATYQLAPVDVSADIRQLFRKHKSISVKLGDVTSTDPLTKTVTLEDGQTYVGDYLVLAAGSQANFFDTPGAEYVFPLYSLDDARRLRSRILAVFEDADRDPSRVDQGALNFVIVGAGATGTEVAGALAELIRHVLPSQFHELALEKARVIVVDLGDAVLGPFSPKAHDYASKVLKKDGVEIRLGTSVKEIADGHVVLSDGDTIPTHCVIWGGGIKAAQAADTSGLKQGRGGRIDVEPDLSVPDHPGVYVVGDIANIPDPEGSIYPQLGSVALQTGQWAAKNILAEIKGEPREPFDYNDKGIMAMIGRNAAVAEMGEHRHELHGAVAFAAWLGVHAWLMSGGRQRVDAFVSWAWDYFGKSRAPQVLDSSDAARIDWGEDDDG